MAIIPPRLRNISPAMSAKDGTTGGEIWEISAPAKNSLQWSLILSLGISSGKNIRLLLGSEAKTNWDAIRKQIMNFNPFRHRFSIYFNRNLTKILQDFKKRLNRFTGQKRDKNEKWDNSTKLKYAAMMLECEIVLYETNASGEVKLRKFGLPKSSVQIILFQQSNVLRDETERDIFSFGMNIDHANPKRKEALLHILRKVERDSYVETIFRKGFGFDDNFLCFLLINEFEEIIPCLYDSPYIAWKLSDAGFNTDPCYVKGNELSAFHLCFKLNRIDLVHILYNYASNGFLRSIKTVRTPDSGILEAVNKIAETLDNDCQISNTELKCCTDIRLFNRFQSKVVTSMHGIIESNQCDFEKSDKILESFFQNYLNFFYGECDTFKNYVKFREYCESADIYSCLIFFENILSLSPDRITDTFLEVVVRMFFTALSCKQFPKYQRKTDVDQNSLLKIPFIQRNKLLHAVKILMEESKNNVMKTGTNADKVLEKVRNSLKPFPEVSDELIATRLSRYLTAATKAQIDSTSVQGILTIERAVQVIGETLCTPTPENNLVFGNLLKCCIPTETFNSFIKLRNHCLSKYRPSSMHKRLEFEGDIIRFQKIQRELADLRQILKPIFSTQVYAIEKLLIDTAVKESSKSVVGETLNSELKDLLQIKTRLYDSQKDGFQSVISNALNYFPLPLNSKEKENFQQLLKGFHYLVSHAFETLQPSVQGQLTKEVFHVIDDMDKLVDPKVKTTTLKSDLKDRVTKMRNILLKIFPDIEKTKQISNLRFSPIDELFQDMQKNVWFNTNELSFIRDKVLLYYKNSGRVKTKLIDSLKKEPRLTSDEIEDSIKYLFTSEENKQNILKLYSNNSKQALNVLKRIPDVHKVVSFSSFKDFEMFSERKEAKVSLLELQLPTELREKLIEYLNRKVHFLLNRIKHMEEILINSDEEISNMWQWGRSEEIKKHYQHLMTRLYVEDLEVRASLEMLLFDCMNILPKREDLSCLWTKATGIFTGVNLRDVLSHGSTILENVGSQLCPEDLPSQLISKMLELIKDSDAISALTEFWIKVKPHSKEILEEKITNADDSDLLVKKIKKCDKWKSYLSLLPV